jgi:hypothetical protein
MSTSAVLVQSPSVDFATLLGLCQQALGRSLCEKIDASPIKRSDTERYLASLAEMGHGNVLLHASYSVLIAADEREMLDILAVCGMPFVVSDTLMRGVQVAVVTGTLQQWRDAVKAGSTAAHGRGVREFFNHVMGFFDASVWQDFDQHPLPDNTLYLTYKR